MPKGAAIRRASRETKNEPAMRLVTPKEPSLASGSGSQLESLKKLKIPTELIASVDSLRRKNRIKATIQTESVASNALRGAAKVSLEKSLLVNRNK